MDGPDRQRSQPRSAWTAGLGDGFSQAIELVVTPLLFGIAGAFLDARLQTGRLLTLSLALFGIVGAFVVAYLRYEARMKADDEGKPWARR